MKRRNWFDELTPRFLLGCFAEGDEGDEGAGGGDGGQGGDGGASGADGGQGGGEANWFDGIEDESLRTAVSGFESRDKLLEAVGHEAPAWRDTIGDEKLREHAGRFNTLDDLVKGNLDLRSQVNRAINIPGKDAKPEDIAAFHKQLGVPESVEGYAEIFKAEGEDLNEAEQANAQQWAETFHKLGVPKDTAEAIVGTFRENMAESSAALAKADERFAEESQSTLKREWGEDYAANVRIAGSAAADLFGDDYEAMKQATTRDGNLLMDHPAMVKMLAKVGREMQEGRMAPVNDDDRAALSDNVREIREQITKAQEAGDSKRANELFQKEQELIARMNGNQTIVGSQGRAA